MDEPGGSYSFAHGARKVAPFSVAVFGFGMSFGVLARPAMGTVAPIVMSVTTFAGSAQFAAASILAGGGTLAAAVGGQGPGLVDDELRAQEPRPPRPGQ